MDKNERYFEKGIQKIFYFDIETTLAPNLSSQLGNMLCWVGAIRNLKIEKISFFHDMVNREDFERALRKRHLDVDARLLNTLAFRMMQTDLVIGHYSSKFDMPYFRSRCHLTNQSSLIPPYGQLKYGDTWRMSKMSLKNNNNSLKSVSEVTLGNHHKTEVKSKYWRLADRGDTRSIKYILDHCKKDVTMLVKIHKKLEVFNPIPSSLR